MPGLKHDAAAPSVAPISMGVLMRRSGLARQTIHFYLRKGLLPKAHRTSRTYALYPPNAIELLNIVKRCQTEFRLSLDEIAKIFNGANYDARRIGAELELRKLTAPPSGGSRDRH